MQPTMRSSIPLHVPPSQYCCLLSNHAPTPVTPKPQLLLFNLDTKLLLRAPKDSGNTTRAVVKKGQRARDASQGQPAQRALRIQGGGPDHGL